MVMLAKRPPGDPALRLFWLMLGVFFGGGLLASVESLLVPRLRLLLHFGFAEALLVQLLYYAGYLLFAWPATALMARVGAMRATALGLTVMAAGCSLLAATQIELAVASMLIALLLLSGGVTVLQIACNGIMSTHGGARKAVARFTLLQGFNAVGTVVGPFFGAQFLLGRSVTPTAAIVFIGFAFGFAGLAFLFHSNRNLLGPPAAFELPTYRRLRALLVRPRMARGTAAIFAYVGAEVTIGTLAVNYLMLADRAHAGAVGAGRLLSLYWAGAMIGRFAGALALARISAPALLAFAATAATALVAAAIVLRGDVGSAALLSVGLCNSIMFPTIYALTMPTAPADMPAGAMLLCMAVVGGAVIPMLTGLLADHANLALSLVLPTACYLGIALYASAEKKFVK